MVTSSRNRYTLRSMSPGWGRAREAVAIRAGFIHAKSRACTASGLDWAGSSEGDPMDNQELVRRAQAVLFQNYRTQPIALLRGEGTWVYDADGKRYLDFIGGIATVSGGHANPRVRQALVEQANLIWHASNLYVTEPQIRL